MIDNTPPVLFASMFPSWNKLIRALIYGTEKSCEVLLNTSFMMFLLLILVASIKITWWVIFVFKF